MNYAYDPFKMYHLSPPTVEGIGCQYIDDMGFQLLDDLATRKLSGLNAEGTVRCYLLRLTRDEAQLFKMILNKDLRCGISCKTINAIWPGTVPTHDVMLAHKFEEKRVKYPCWATTKLDGVRSLYRDGEFYTRNGHKLVGLTNLKHYLLSLDAPPLDLELYIPDETFQVSSGLIRSFAEKHAHAYILDLPTNEISPLFCDKLKEMKKYTGDCIEPIPACLVTNFSEIKALYDEALKAGHEGLVIRPWAYDYEWKRSHKWMKMKQVETEDLRVIGLYEGKGKYRGMLGGIIVDRQGVPVRVGSGLSDEDRQNIWQDGQESAIGNIAEVLYHEVTPDGSLRHPRFLRWRFDK